MALGEQAVISKSRSMMSTTDDVEDRISYVKRIPHTDTRRGPTVIVETRPMSPLTRGDATWADAFESSSS